MSKQMLVTLPFVLLLLDYWPLRRVAPWSGQPVDRAGRLSAQLRRWAPLVIEKVPFFLLAAGASVVTFLVQSRAGATLMLTHLALTARVANALLSYCRYIGKLFWPLNLAVFYPHPGSWPAAEIVVATVLLVGATLLAWRGARRFPFALVGWLWFLGTLVPVIGIIQVGRQSMADRYTYIPLLGLLVILVWGFYRCIQAWGARPVVLPAAAAPFVVACGLLTFRQVGCWKSSEVLFRHALEAVPDNYLAHGNLGNVYQKQGHFAEALREFDEVLRLRPDDANTRNNLGTMLLEAGRFEEAAHHFQLVVDQMPDFAEAHNNLAYACQRLGRLDEALTHYQEALKLEPNDYRVHINLAGVFLAQGQAELAVRELQAAVRLKPDEAGTRRDLGSLLFNAGRLDEAIEQFAAAVKLAPQDAQAQGNLGISLARKGRREEAVTHLTLALKLQPDYPEAQQQLQALTGAPQR